jgi:hypothetical protein
MIAEVSVLPVTLTELMVSGGFCTIGLRISLETGTGSGVGSGFEGAQAAVSNDKKLIAMAIGIYFLRPFKALTPVLLVFILHFLEGTDK